MRATKLLVGTSAGVQSDTSAIGNGDNRRRCHLRKCVKLKLCFHRRLHSADAARANSGVAINLFAFYVVCIALGAQKNCAHRTKGALFFGYVTASRFTIHDSVFAPFHERCPVNTFYCDDIT